LIDSPVAGQTRHAQRLLNALRYRLRAGRIVIADAAKDVAIRVRMALRRRPAGSRARADTRHILFVDDLPPDPLFGAGYPRAFEMVRSLVRMGHRVSMYPMTSTRADMARMRDLYGEAVRFHAGGGARGLRRLLWRYGDDFDILLISRPAPMRAWNGLGRSSSPDARAIPVIYDAEALLAPRERRRRALFGPAWSDDGYGAALSSELALIADADAITVVGHEDAATVHAAFDVPVFILPHSIEVRDATPGFDVRRDILFVGRLTGTSADSPNVDSLVWFLREVMPLLDDLIGTDYHFHIVGRTDAPELAASDRVILHGVVEELAPLYDRCRIFVAPTRYAAGIPLKVLEAMGQGIACVATPLLAEQLGCNTAALPNGGDPRAFAEQCHRLYTDPAAWTATRDAAAAYLARNCSPTMFDRVLGDALDSVARPTTRR
jgi:glycosyltransferase involved in cell wall biosynthesis